MKKIKKAWNYYRHYGFKLFLLKCVIPYKEKTVDYDKWLKYYDANKRDLENQSNQKYEKKILFSIAVPVYQTPEKFLRDMVESVLGQSYPYWELCIADGSENYETFRIIEEYAKYDKRIKVKHLNENKGIAENTNEALKLCTGEYIGLLDHDDILAPNALYELRCAIDKNSNPEIIYTDEDKMSLDGKEFFEPHFKSNFNPELLRSNNYICHFFVIKNSILQETKGLKKKYDGAQDYDFILRCTELADSIVHIPKPLYHWRIHALSTASHPESKLYAYKSGKKAIEDHLERKGEMGSVEYTENYGFYHVKYKIRSYDKISIIIITGSDKRLTSHFYIKKCINSIKKTSGYKNYHIIVVDSLENLNVKSIMGRYILLVNSKIMMISQEWLEEMLGNCQRKQVGAVGIKLYNRNETIRHGGIILGMRKYAFEGWPRVKYGYFHRDSLMQNLSAVTKDFMMLSTELFMHLWEEAAVCLLDERKLCQEIRKRGREVIYNPNIEAYIWGNSAGGTICLTKDEYYDDNLGWW